MTEQQGHDVARESRSGEALDAPQDPSSLMTVGMLLIATAIGASIWAGTVPQGAWFLVVLAVAVGLGGITLLLVGACAKGVLLALRIDRERDGRPS